MSRGDASDDARAAARREGDRRVLRLGRRRQDVGRGRGRARRGGPARRQGARAHDRPGPRLATALGLDGIGNRRAPGAARGAEGGGRRAARRAVGRDARHEAVVGRPRAAPRARTRRPRTASSRTGCTTTSPARFVQSHDYIAMERLYEIHASGEYDLIVIDTPPTRNAIDFLDAPAAHGRLLRRPAAALAHAAVPRRRQARQRACSTSRAGPSTKWPTASSGSKFLEDIAEFFLNFQSMYDGFVDARERGRAAAARPAHDVRGRHHARSRAAARGRAASATSCSTAQVPPRRAGAQQDAARLPARPGRRARPRPRSSTTPAAIAEALADARPIPRSPIRARTRPGAAHDRRVVPQLLGRRDARSRAARRARARARRRRAGARPSRTTSATSTAWRAIGRAPVRRHVTARALVTIAS